MKWILIVLGVLIGMGVLVYVVGILLPQQHVAKRSAYFKVAPEQVWKVITDFESAPDWRTELKSIERLPDHNGHAVWRETSRFGAMTYEVTEFIPPLRMVTTIADEKLPFGGSWTYEVTAIDDGTQLTVTENGKVYNPVFRFMSKFVFGHHKTIEGYLRALGRQFGEETILLE